jgi:trans-aconitate 2-methyltransferase
MPLSWGMVSHRLMRDTLADGGPGGAPLGTEALRVAMARKWVEDADVYYDWLSGRVRHLDIWETEYVQVLQGEDPVLEWVTSTGLRPILNGLDDADRAIFLDTYRQRLRTAYPMRTDGHTLYPFRRLFIVAVV